MVTSGQQRNNGTGAIQHVRFQPGCKLDFISSKPHQQFHAHSFLFYQHVQTLPTFTISVISGHSDFADFHYFYYIRTFRLLQFLLYQDIQTLLIFTTSITSRYSDFADFDNFCQDIQTFTISIRTFRHCWLSQFLSGHSDFADFHNFYYIRTFRLLLTFTFSKESGFRCFGWRVPYWLQATITSTAVTHRTLGERKYTHTNSIFLKSKHTQTVKHALSKLCSQRWHQQRSEILNTCNASSASLSFQCNHTRENASFFLFLLNPQDPTHVQNERDGTHPWCCWSWKVGRRQRIVAVQHGLKRWHLLC